MASFVTTWMEAPARRLIMDALPVNHVDGAIYRSSREIEHKCAVQACGVVYPRVLHVHPKT